MILNITNTSMMSDVQRQFQNLFPNLKIEFYKVPHLEGQSTPEEYKWKTDQLIENTSDHFSEGSIQLTLGMNVSILERLFREHFGLYIQIFRRSGEEWIETTSTDDWSLKKQNEIGGLDLDVEEEE